MMYTINTGLQMKGITLLIPRWDYMGLFCPWSNISVTFLPGMRMEQSFCQWKQTCVMRKQKRMSPTFPTTIWSLLKLTSWSEIFTPRTIANGYLMLLYGSELCSGAAHSCSKLMLLLSVASSSSFLESGRPTMCTKILRECNSSTTLCFAILCDVTSVPHP